MEWRMKAPAWNRSAWPLPSVGHAEIEAGPAERKAEERVGRQAIIGAHRGAVDAARRIVRARRPSPRCWSRRSRKPTRSSVRRNGRRRLRLAVPRRHRGIGLRRFIIGAGVAERPALLRKTRRAAVGAPCAEMPVVERVEQHVHELIAGIERRLRRVRARLAGKLRQPVTKRVPAQPHQRDEAGRQCAAIVEERIDRGGDVALVSVQPGCR